MGVKFSILDLRMVKESTAIYDFQDKIVSSPGKCKEVLEQVFDMSNLSEETLVLMCLNPKNAVTGLFKVSQGSLTTSIVHPREIFKRAMMNNACSIIIAHNHTSGSTEPSSEDICLTKRIQRAGEILGIKLYDHLIISDGKFTSFRQDNLMDEDKVINIEIDDLI